MICIVVRQKLTHCKKITLQLKKKKKKKGETAKEREGGKISFCRAAVLNHGCIVKSLG